MKRIALAVCSIGLACLAGCTKVSSDSSKGPADPTTTTTIATPNATTAPLTQATVVPSEMVPAGTSFRVRLLQTIDTKRNRAGDHFTAALDEPLVDGDRVVVPKGTTFSGHITEAKPSGRFKGRAVLALTLDSFTLDGRVYAIHSSDPARSSRGHKGHNAAWIGGGAGGGALVGAAAGGGTGALIGAGAGAAAGTVGSLFTGKRQVSLPVETTLRFRLETPVSLG